MLSHPRTLSAIAILIEIVMTAVVSPIISDIRENHNALKSEFAHQIADAHSDLDAIRQEIYRDFVTSPNHDIDVSALFNQLNRLERRLYELNSDRP